MSPSSRPARPARRIAPLAAAVLILAPACRPAASGASGAGSGVIATIRGEAVTRDQFDAYVDLVLRAGGEAEREAPTPALMSRLLDRFLDEEILVREARAQGIEVSEREVTEELRALRSPEGGAGAGGPDERTRMREGVRRSLLVKKLREERLLRDLTVSPEEIAAYYEAHRADFRQEARLVLRQILLDDRKEARRLRDTLVRDPASFQILAEEKSLAPDAGRARAYEEALLPPAMLQAVREVPPGHVSEVVEGPDGHRIFLVERRQEGRLIDIDEASDRIRVTLLQQKGKRAFESMMEDLRERAELMILEENIPFRYVRRPA